MPLPFELGTTITYDLYIENFFITRIVWFDIDDTLYLISEPRANEYLHSKLVY